MFCAARWDVAGTYARPAGQRPPGGPGHVVRGRGEERASRSLPQLNASAMGINVSVAFAKVLLLLLLLAVREMQSQKEGK